MVLFPVAPNTNDTYWHGEDLYTFTGDGWDKTYDLTPLHHWRLNDVSGQNNASDSGTNPIAGSITSCVLSQTGQISRSMQFTGTASYIFAFDSTTKDVATVALWAKLNDMAGSSGVIFSFGGSVTAANNLYKWSTGSAFGLNTWNNDSYGILSASVLEDGNFNHIAAVFYNSNVSSFRLWINGNEKTTTQVYGTSLNKPLNMNVGIGAAPWNLINQITHGNIEDVRIYDRVLTQQEISAIYNKGRGTYDHCLTKGYPTVKSPIHHWKLQENTGTVVNDLGSSPNIGTNTSVDINQLGNIGNSYYFKGTTTSYCYMPDPNIATGTPFSIAFWARRDGNTDYAAFMGYDSTHRLLVGTTGRLLDQQAGNLFSEDGAVPNKTWTHIIYWNSGTEAQWYVNGKKSGDPITTSLAEWTSAFYLGNYNLISYRYPGNLEDIRIYDYALSQQEIANIYNNGKGTHL